MEADGGGHRMPVLTGCSPDGKLRSGDVACGGYVTEAFQGSKNPSSASTVWGKKKRKKKMGNSGQL